MSFFYQSAFLQALGWSLIDSLWQMGVLWLVYSLITLNGKMFNARFRHSLAVLALSSGFVWFIINIGFNYYAIASGSTAYVGLDAINFFYKFTPYISSSYLLMLIFFGVRWVLQYRASKGICNKHLISPDGRFELLLNQLQQLTGIKKEVRLWFSENITTPLTTGFLKPVILFPVAALNHLSLKQAEALIVHELFHIKRNDYLVNLFIDVADIIFFFNPFARLLKSTIKKERENACDDEVLRLGYDSWEYSQALYLLGRNDAADYHFVLAATGKGKQLLLQRIKRMMNKQHPSPSVLKPSIAFFLCLFLAGSINRNVTVSEEGIPLIKSKNITETTTQVSEDNQAPVFIRQTVIIEKKAQAEKKHKVRITRLILPATPPTPAAPPKEYLEETGDIIIASYISNDARSLSFCFVPSSVADFQKPENCSLSEPFLPNSTFYFPTHQVLSRENGKTTIQL